MSFDNVYTGTNEFLEFSQYDSNIRLSTMTGSVERLMILDITGNIKDSSVDVTKIAKSPSGSSIAGGKVYANITGLSNFTINVATGLTSVSAFLATPLEGTGLSIVNTYSIPDSSSSTQQINSTGVALGTNQYGFAWHAHGSS